MKISITSHAIGVTFGATVAFLALNLLGSVCLARLLGPEGRGALAALLFWPHLLAGIGNLSVNEALTKQMAGFGHSEQYLLLRVSIGLALSLGLVTTLIGLLISPVLLGTNRANLLNATRMYMVFFLPISMVTSCVLSYEQGALRFIRYNQLRMIQPVIYVVGIITLASSGMISVGSVTIMTLASVVFAALGTWLYTKLPLPMWNAHAMRDLAATGLKYHAINLSMFAVNEIDRLLVIKWCPDEDVGIYAVATSISMLGMSVIAQTASTILFPSMAWLRDERQRSELFCRSTRISVVLVVLVNGGAFLLAPFVIPFVFGQGFVAAVSVTQALLAAYSFKTIRRVMERSVRGSGVVSFGFIAELAVLAVFLGSAHVCFRSFGLMGFAVALTAGQMAGVGVMGFAAYRCFGVLPSDWLSAGFSTWRDLFVMARKATAKN